MKGPGGKPLTGCRISWRVEEYGDGCVVIVGFLADQKTDEGQIAIVRINRDACDSEGDPANRPLFEDIKGAVELWFSRAVEAETGNKPPMIRHHLEPEASEIA